MATESFSGVWILQSFFPNKNIILMEFCSIKHSFFSLTNIIAFRWNFMIKYRLWFLIWCEGKVLLISTLVSYSRGLIGRRLMNVKDVSIDFFLTFKNHSIPRVQSLSKFNMWLLNQSYIKHKMTTIIIRIEIRALSE